MARMANILISCLCLHGASAHASDWTVEDTSRQAVFYALKVIDWRQTLSLKNNQNLQEANPLLGSHPSDARVNNFIAGAMLLETGIAIALEPEQRAYFQYLMIGFTGYTAWHNWRVGAKVSF